MICAQCGDEHKRKRFCCNRCKDAWWNKQPHRAERTERISGFTPKTAYDEIEDTVHPYSAEGLGQDLGRTPPN